MAQEERKRLLIVDDTKIDRMVLKGILGNDYEILEASSGNMAFEYLTTREEQLDAILLDLSMPHIDGFDVLKFMQEKGMNDIPVFVITAEPTRDNVERAVQYNVNEFIGKPFDKDDILWRLRSRLGITPECVLQKEEITEMQKYIADLENVYKSYLVNFGKDDKHYRIMVDLMRILLQNYSKATRNTKLTSDKIEFISKAAYFCDIGEMLIPDSRLQMMAGQARNQFLEQMHTMMGANLIKLNRSKNCSYFVEVCSSMCLHHHERFDGKGYPHGIVGRNNSIYNQMCRLVDELDQKRSMFYGDSAKPVKFVIKGLTNNDDEMVSRELSELLNDCEPLIVNYFIKQDAKESQ